MLHISSYFFLKKQKRSCTPEELDFWLTYNKFLTKSDECHPDDYWTRTAFLFVETMARELSDLNISVVPKSNKSMEFMRDKIVSELSVKHNYFGLEQAEVIIPETEKFSEEFGGRTREDLERSKFVTEGQLGLLKNYIVEAHKRSSELYDTVSRREVERAKDFFSVSCVSLVFIIDVHKPNQAYIALLYRIREGTSDPNQVLADFMFHKFLSKFEEGNVEYMTSVMHSVNNRKETRSSNWISCREKKPSPRGVASLFGKAKMHMRGILRKPHSIYHQFQSDTAHTIDYTDFLHDLNEHIALLVKRVAADRQRRKCDALREKRMYRLCVVVTLHHPQSDYPQSDYMTIDMFGCLGTAEIPSLKRLCTDVCSLKSLLTGIPDLDEEIHRQIAQRLEKEAPVATKKRKAEKINWDLLGKEDVKHPRKKFLPLWD